MTQNPPRINISLAEQLAHAQRLKSIVAMAQRKGGVVTLTPAGAQAILDHLNFPGQRAINPSRVYGHRYAIIEGNWLEGHAITLTEMPDGRIWLVDGQHRLTAIAEGGVNVAITVRIVESENEREARNFYAGFDQATSVRTNAQVIEAVQAHEGAGVSKAMAEAVLNASTLLANSLEPLTGAASIKKNQELFLPATRLRAILDWSEEAQQYEQIIKKAKRTLRTKLLQAGPTAVALYTLRHQPAKAHDFWRGLAENDGLRSNDPRAALYADLLTRNLGSGSIRQRVQQSAMAWNAFFRGRTLQQIKCVQGGLITLLGTPLKG